MVGIKNYSDNNVAVVRVIVEFQLCKIGLLLMLIR